MFFRSFLRSNIIISAGAAALYTHYSLNFQGSVSLPYALLIFLGTYISYELMRIIGNYRNQKELNKKKLSILSLITCLSFPLLFILDRNDFVFILLGSLIVLFYERLFLKNFSLRKIPYSKPFLISIVWVLICACMAINEWNSRAFFIITDCFIFISLLCIPFDISDHFTDKKFELKTFSHLFNEQKYLKQILSSTFLLYSIVQLFFIEPTVKNGLLFLVMNGVYLYSLKMMSRDKKNKNDLYLYLGFDGIILIKSLVVYSF